MTNPNTSPKHAPLDPNLSRLRVGQGIDIHPFANIGDQSSSGPPSTTAPRHPEAQANRDRTVAEGRACTLGGVPIAHSRQLDGHSDADVLLHAIIDALLGAAGKQDIGCLFPNTDPAFKGISSVELLRRTWQTLSAQGFQIINLDSCILAEAPKIAPHVPAMKETIASALGISATQIGIKATTTERLGFVGREEGIVATAVALLLAP